MQNNITHTFSYHIELQGSAYQVGAAQAAAIAAVPEFVAYLQSGKDIAGRPPLAHTLQIFRRWCPSLEEEIQGFCDELKIAPENLIYYASTHLYPAHCSHLVVLPNLTADGHVLAARNYDFGESMDDLRLCTTRLTGQYAHIGFSNQFFGRNDGLNEHGLSVTLSAGGIPFGNNIQGLRSPQFDGLQFWALVRTLLENCRTVAEAVELFQEFPCGGNPILLLADASGRAALAEAFGPHKHVQTIETCGPQSYLAATNHFISPEMRRYDPQVFRHSQLRLEAIQARLIQAAPCIDLEGLKQLMATVYPAGPCAHYYQEFFGTLHAQVFDLTTRQMYVTFGSPAVNPWHLFDLSQFTGNERYPTLLPYEHTTPDFWSPVV